MKLLIRLPAKGNKMCLLESLKEGRERRPWDEVGKGDGAREGHLCTATTLGRPA